MLLSIDKIKRQEINHIVNNPEVTKYFTSIRVFGSSITDRCKESSDIDFFVTIKRDYMDYKGVNDSYLTLFLSSESDKDIFYSHEQNGRTNPRL